jgi:hypothetical protein
MNRTLPTVMIAAVFGLAGCGNDQPTAAPNPFPITAAPSPPPSSAPAAAPTPHRLGYKVTASDGQVEATVLAYKQPVDTDVDADRGMQFGAAQVRVCARAAGVEVSSRPWQVAYTDGEVLARADWSGATGFPTPEYPWEAQPIAVGRCVKGWITFQVIAGRKPEFVQYLPDGEPLPIEWRTS